MKKIIFTTCLALVASQLSFAARGGRRGNRGNRARCHKPSPAVRKAAHRSAVRLNKVRKTVVHHHRGPVVHKTVIHHGPRRPVARPIIRRVVKPIVRGINRALRGRVKRRPVVVQPVVRPVVCPVQPVRATPRERYFRFIQNQYIGSASALPVATRVNSAMIRLGHHIPGTPVAVLRFVYNYYYNAGVVDSGQAMDQAIAYVQGLPNGVRVVDIQANFM